MDMKKIQEQCNQFLQGLGVPGFVIIGIAQDNEKVSMVYSVHKMPTKGLIKSMTKALNDFVQKM